MRLEKALAVIMAGAFLFLLYWFWLQQPMQVLVLEGSTMGTSWSVQIVADGEGAATPELATSLQQRLTQLDRDIFSTYTQDSELMQFNASPAGVWVELSPELYEVLLLASNIHQHSDGAFDPTVAPLVRLWGFGADSIDILPPPVSAIEAALARLGMDQLLLDASNRRAMKTGLVEFDLSAIAKGYAVDVLAKLLQGEGHDNFLVEIGGELRVSGSGRNGEGWTLAIEQPDALLRLPFAELPSDGTELALAGSGNYRNYREVGNRRYSHEIDPRSGFPVEHTLAAVTVQAADAASADAWATALMILGPEQGLELADREAVAAHFIISGPSGFESRSSVLMKAQFPDL